VVAKALAYDGDSTQAELTDATVLPPRTVRYALTKLEANGLVTSRISLVDARKHIYALEWDADQAREQE
jgi:DNA-binding MarR family transcriptional regulator